MAAGAWPRDGTSAAPIDSVATAEDDDGFQTRGTMQYVNAPVVRIPGGSIPASSVEAYLHPYAQGGATSIRAEAAA
eukprot:8700299-Prorocentrum_lima.AAC.1